MSYAVDYEITYNWSAPVKGALDKPRAVLNHDNYTLYWASASQDTINFNNGIKCKVTFKMRYSGSDTPLESDKYALLRWRDIDQPDYAGNYNKAEYCEAIQFNNEDHLYGKTVYTGTARTGHKNASSNNKKLDKDITEKRLSATHVCEGGSMACSEVVAMARSGVQYTLTGSHYAGTMTGIEKQDIWWTLKYNNNATGKVFSGITPEKKQYPWESDEESGRSGDNKVTTENPKTYSCVGYTFAGWSKNKNYLTAGNWGELTKPGKNFVSHADPFVTITLYAQWQEIKYKVIYHSNYDPDKKKTYKVDYTKPHQISPKDTFTRPGYRFKCWNTKANGTGSTTYQGGEQVKNLCTTQGGEYHLYAQWEKLPTVNFVVDGQPFGSTQTIAESELGLAYAVPSATTEAARKANCHRISGVQGLQAWYKDGDCTQIYAPRQLAIGENLTLYARNLATIRFENGEGADASPDNTYYDRLTGGTLKHPNSYLPAAIECAYGKTATLPVMALNVRLYYNVEGMRSRLAIRAKNGWSTLRSGGTSATHYVVLGDATYYKQWGQSGYDGVETSR